MVEEKDERTLAQKAAEDYGIVNADQMDSKQLKAEMSAIDDQANSVDTTESADTDSESAGESNDEASDVGAEVDLASLKRDELNAHAAELGIEDPEKLPSKNAVVEAIEAKQAE
jgi:hypothetical protein